MRVMSRIVLSAAAAVSFAGAAQAQSFTGVANGGFETPDVPGSYGTFTGNQINGWTVTSGNVDLVSRPTYTPSEGNQALDLVGTGTNTGSIAQTLNNLIVNKVYRLVFSYSGNSDNSQFYTANVAVSGSSLFQGPSKDPVTGAFGAIGGQAYVQYAASFIATSVTQTLSFSDTSGRTNQGVFLDDVSVQAAVPELATWAMMIVGFGMVGSVIRRRRATLRPALANA